MIKSRKRPVRSSPQFIIPFYEHLSAALGLSMFQVVKLATRYNGHYVMDARKAHDVVAAVMEALGFPPPPGPDRMSATD